jgi:NADH:ubiquinone oxidoreductase subunit 2 (subunit N)
LLGVVYYFALIKALLVDKPSIESTERVSPSWSFRVVAGVLLVGTILLTVTPNVWLEKIATKATIASYNVWNPTAE